MTYQEAQQEALKVEWETGICPQGEECWCRNIRPKTPIIHDNDDTFYICNGGAIDKEIAEHIVKIHNDSLKRRLLLKQIT